jgi:phosphoribosylcarboxyaminoimidazole (NCAIR) mutase
MTEQEQRLADDKMRAEIFELQTRAVKQMRESVYSPLIAGAGAAAALMAATAAIVKLFF